MNIDKFLHKTVKTDYKCIDLVRDVWLDAFGEDIGPKLKSMFESRLLRANDVANFQRLDKPVNPCFVLLQRKPPYIPHVGIWYNNRIMHLADTGAQYVRMFEATRRYTRVTFFK